MCDEENETEMHLLVDGLYGQYVPQHFAVKM